MCVAVESGDVSIDAALELLADQRRRLAIQYLRGAPDGVASFEELVDYVSTECPNDTRKRLQTHLHHVSLPRLDKSGLIDYDHRSQTIRYHANSVVDELVESIEKIEMKEA